MAILSCRFFNGYKPCGRFETCDQTCPQKDIIENQILIIHLGALGAVVRSTSLLDSIRSKYPRSKVTWLTDRPADQLLRNHPNIDEILTTDYFDIQKIKGRKFDISFVIDKSERAAGLLEEVHSKYIFGFKRDSYYHVIVPATPAAQELWELGLSNQKKFFENKKTEVQLVLEALELQSYSSQPGSCLVGEIDEKRVDEKAAVSNNLHYNKLPDYNLPLTDTEKKIVYQKRKDWTQSQGQILLGINTGCGSLMPAKKLSLEYQRQLIISLQKNWGEQIRIILLGGPEDTQRNFQIVENLDVVLSATDKGLRDGYTSVAACDLVITGDSLGMHMAIALNKYVLAWFGPSCAHEIELYGRGEALLTQATCSPCWKRECTKPVMCYDQLSLSEVLAAVKRQISKIKLATSQFELPSEQNL